MLKDILTLFYSDKYNLLVYLVMGLLAILGVFKCIFPVLSNSYQLNRAIRYLELGAKGKNRPIWQEPQFLGRSLQLHWQKFLLNAQHLDIRGIPCNASDYINEDSVVYIPGHAQFGELLPTLFTSLGILGTFIGLSQGLGNLNISDAQKTMESIPVLLDGMKYAFNTSIVGVTCSLAFNMINRIVIGHAFKTLDSFDEAFYELAMPRPLDPTVQLICQNQDSTAILKSSSENLKNAISNVIKISLENTLVPVANSMDNFIEVCTSQQIDGIDKIVSKFLNNMNSSLNNQFKSLSETMNLINKSNIFSFDTLQKNMDSINAINNDIISINNACKNIVALANEKIDSQPVLSNDNNYKKELIASIDSIKKSTDIQNEFISNLKEFKNLSEKTYGQYVSKTESLANTISQNSNKNIEEIRIMIKDNQESLNNIVKNYSNSSEKIANSLQNTIISLNNALKDMSKVLQRGKKDV